MARRRDPDRVVLSHRVQSLFGERLQAARRNSPKRISQEELATVLGVSRTSVSNIERGRHRVFLDQAYAAARALGVGIEDLLPKAEDVFPEAGILTAPHARLTDRSVREVSQITKEIQQRLASGLEAIALPVLSTTKGGRAR